AAVEDGGAEVGDVGGATPPLQRQPLHRAHPGGGADGAGEREGEDGAGLAGGLGDAGFDGVVEGGAELVEAVLDNDAAHTVPSVTVSVPVAAGCSVMTRLPVSSTTTTVPGSTPSMRSEPVLFSRRRRPVFSWRISGGIRTRSIS